MDKSRGRTAIVDAGIDLFSTAGISAEWEVPFGQHHSTVAAPATTRYKYESGTTDEQLSADPGRLAGGKSVTRACVTQRLR